MGPALGTIQLENRLRELAGGFTREDGPAGKWVAGERVYHDASRRYTVAIQSWRQFPAWLEIVEWIRIEFRQEALYIRVQRVAEILGDN